MHKEVKNCGREEKLWLFNALISHFQGALACVQAAFFIVLQCGMDYLIPDLKSYHENIPTLA